MQKFLLQISLLTFCISYSANSLLAAAAGGIDPALLTAISGILAASEKGSPKTVAIFQTITSDLSDAQVNLLLQNVAIKSRLFKKIGEAVTDRNLLPKPAAGGGGGGMTKQELEDALAAKGVDADFAKSLAEGDLKQAFASLFNKEKSGYKAALAAYGNIQNAKEALKKLAESITA